MWLSLQVHRGAAELVLVVLFFCFGESCWDGVFVDVTSAKYVHMPSRIIQIQSTRAVAGYLSFRLFFSLFFMSATQT